LTCGWEQLRRTGIEESSVAKKIGMLLLIAFLIFFVVNSPADAAAVVKNVQHLLGHGFASISEFIRSFRD
jgi:hypothetical protein